jgi:hypothetical protein
LFVLSSFFHVSYCAKGNFVLGQSKSSVEQEYVRMMMMMQSSTFLQSALRAESAVKGNRVKYPENEKWAKNLAFVARMIAGGMATQVYLMNMPLWNFHLNQINDQQEYLITLGGRDVCFSARHRGIWRGEACNDADGERIRTARNAHRK